MIIAALLLSLMPLTVGAQGTDINSRDLRGKVVYQDDEVVFRQLDEHTWIGNGHRVYNESLYLVEGNDRALLIDAGTVIPDLDKIVAKITTKPVTMILTHAHGDHAGGVGPFPEVFLNAGDMPLVSNSMRSYKGQIRYLFESLRPVILPEAPRSSIRPSIMASAAMHSARPICWCSPTSRPRCTLPSGLSAT